MNDLATFLAMWLSGLAAGAVLSALIHTPRRPQP